MADGLNNVRAMRVAELVNDFYDLQKQVAEIVLPPAADTSNEEGFALMRQCKAQSRALLRQPFDGERRSCNNEEKNKTHLQRIIADAAVRRFRAWKIHMYLDAALRWAYARDAHLRGSQPEARHTIGLNELHESLRAEIATITDVRVDAASRAKDTSEGKWMAEDPPLSFIQGYTTTTSR